MTPVTVDGIEFQGEIFTFAHSSLLFIRGRNGILGCGYFDLAAAEKTGEAVAVVTGVKSLDDMLNAAVVRASSAALELGVRTGMTGREALKLLGRK